VRPVVTLQGYDALRVEVPSPEVPDEAVDSQVDALRERFADLEESSQPLIDGNFASIDIKTSVHDEVIDSLSATDFLYEVGSGMLVDELDTELRGAGPGAILKFNATLPDRFGDRAGEEVTFQVLVKEAKRKVLPDTTDEWVSEVSEFDTVDALRQDVRDRLGLVGKVQAQMLVRDKVLEAAAALVDIEVPDALVADEMQGRLHDLVHRLEAQGLDIPQYLAATGQEQDAFLATLRASSSDAVRADLALRAVVAQEEIEASDDDVSAEIERLAERLEAKPARVRKDLEQRGAIEALRSDLARGKALRFLVDHAEVVDEDGNTVDLTLPEPTDSTEPTESSDTPEASVASTSTEEPSE
jgi:trigger factor